MKVIEWVGSPNFNKGRNQKISKIVVHWMAGTLQGTDKWFSKKKSKASAHYGIANNKIHQYVDEADTAWHAGNWDMNNKSIGIEHEGHEHIPITETTYVTSAELISDICSRYNLPIDKTTIIPHRDIVATRCPGTLDINKLIKYAKIHVPDIKTPEIPVKKPVVVKGWDYLKGKKTYVVAIVTIFLAIAQYYSGDIGLQDMVNMILAALGLGAVRHGIASK